MHMIEPTLLHEAFILHAIQLLAYKPNKNQQLLNGSVLKKVRYELGA